MKNLSALLSILLFGLGICAFPQDYPGAPGCVEPVPLKVDEFTFANEAELIARVGGFKKELAERDTYHQGVIHLYGGRKARSDGIQKMLKKIENELGVDQKKLWIRPMGYRNSASAEFFILPMQCTQYPPALGDLRIDEIEFEDMPSRRIQTSEISDHILKEPEAKCAPAARAVRACVEGTEIEVFIVINKKGDVVFSESIGGHPFNRAAAAATVRQYVFKPFLEGGEAVQVSGTIRVIYSKPDEIVITN